MPDGSIDVCLFSGGIRSDARTRSWPGCSGASRGCSSPSARAPTRAASRASRTSRTVAAILDAAYDGIQHRQPGRPPAARRPGRRPRASCTCPPCAAVCGRSTRSCRSTTACPAARRSRRASPRSLGARSSRRSTATVPAAAAGRVARRRSLHGLRRVPPDAQRQADHARSPGSRTLETIDPALCLLEQGHPLQRPGDPRRLRCAVPGRRRPVHRLLRARADGVVDYGARLLSAFASVVDATSPRHIDADPRRPARPGRPVLPLRPRRVAARRRARRALRRRWPRGATRTGPEPALAGASGGSAR